jgi:hypothetical protein
MELGKYIAGLDPYEKDGGGMFKITLSEKFFDAHDILITANGSKVRIVGDIEESHTRWWHKVLNWLTFRKYFVRGYVYDCKIVKKQ